MKLLKLESVSEARAAYTLGHSPWGPLVILLVLVGSIGFLGALAWNWPVNWLVIAVMIVLGLFMGGILLLAIYATAHTVLACFRSTNWLMKASDEGIYLQVRSYANYHFPREGPTVAFVPFFEIASVGKVTFRHDLKDADGDKRTTVNHYLDIELRGVDTQPLAELVASERALKPRNTLKVGYVPVQVPRAGWVRVDWLGKKMLKLFPPQVEVHQPTRLSFDDATTNRAKIDDEIVRLIEQGDTISATAMLRRHEGMSLTEAKRFVDDLTRKLAEGR